MRSRFLVRITRRADRESGGRLLSFIFFRFVRL